MSNTLSDGLDANQTIILSYDDSQQAHRSLPINNLIPVQFDSISMSYISAGNGAGEMGTVSYYDQGELVAMITLSYDDQNRLISVTRA